MSLTHSAMWRIRAAMAGSPLGVIEKQFASFVGRAVGMEGAIVQRDGADMNTEPVPAAKTPWLSSLGQLSTVTAALSVLIVCLAFIHEWAYFRVVGMQFQALMSPSDYITSVIGWLPLFALGMTVPWLNEMFTRRLEGFVLSRKFEQLTKRLGVHGGHMMRRM